MVLLGHQVNREKRVIEVFQALQDHMVPKETMVSLVLQVHSVPSARLDYLALQVPKEPKVQLVKQDQRERLVHLEFLVLLVLLVMSSTRSHSKLPKKAERVGTLMPANWWTMLLWIPTTKITMTAWRKSLAHSTHLSWRSSR